MKLAVVWCGVLLLAAGALSAGGQLSIRVSPRVAFSPANILVRTFVERDSDNREIQVVADSPNFFSSSSVQLDGDDAPRSKEFRFRDLPAGDYTIVVVLIGQDGKQRAIASSTVIIN